MIKFNNNHDNNYSELPLTLIYFYGVYMECSIKADSILL